MMLVYIVEEYGYRHWVWRYPHSREQLILDWKNGKAPINFYDPSTSPFDGELIQLGSGLVTDPTKPMVLLEIPYIDANNLDEVKEKCDAWAHVHDADDTFLQFEDDEKYPRMPDYTTILDGP